MDGCLFKVSPASRRSMRYLSRMGGDKLPTFTISRPSAKPMRKPAGLGDCLPDEVQRWRDHQHRFPPHQHKDNHCIIEQGRHRPPSMEEPEAILGFPRDYTVQCMKKSDHGGQAHQDCRLTLLGNSWHVGVVSWLLGELLAPLGRFSRLACRS